MIMIIYKRRKIKKDINKVRNKHKYVKLEIDDICECANLVVDEIIK